MRATVLLAMVAVAVILAASTACRVRGHGYDVGDSDIDTGGDTGSDGDRDGDGDVDADGDSDGDGDCATADPVDWMERGPYGAGVGLYEGTLEYEGQSYSHLVQMTWPAVYNGPDAPVAEGGPFPVLVFEHAAGADYQNYDWLFGRLASRGIVVASVEHDANGWNEAWDYYDSHAFLFAKTVDLLAEWQEEEASPLQGALDLDRLAFGGHSHGGGGATLAMRRFLPMDPEADREVAAVVLVATVPDMIDDLDSYAATYAGMPPLLVVVGGNDLNCTSCIAVSEAPARPRAMVLVENADHYSFTDDAPDDNATVPREDAWTASGSAIIAFLSDRLLGEDRAMSGFRRDVPLYQGGAPSRMHLLEVGAFVLDDFDGGGELTVTVSPQGGATAEETWAVNEELALYLPTTALEVTWEEPGGEVGLDLCEPPLDATPWDVLSLRLLPVYADPLNPRNADLDLSIRLVDTDGDEASIPLSGTPQGAMPPPPDRPESLPPSSVFETWRLLLSSFTEAGPGLDLDRLAQVKLVFDRSETGRVLVDDLELLSSPGCQ
jgi:hypothetical protein